MSRYDWPQELEPTEEADDPGGRRAFVAPRRTDFDPDGALAASRTPRQPAHHPGAPAGPFAPATGRGFLWQPLGPLAILGGQASGNPRVSGRVNALAIHTGGQRAYAASANGGVWYSKDGGAHWTSVAGLASTNTAGIKRPAQRNSCGALFVDFGASEGDDLVIVGTGEVVDPMRGEPGDSEGGIGILVGDKPTKNADVEKAWVREAPNLVNDGVFAIVRQPSATTMIAATRTGLWQRPPAPGKDVDWVRLTSKPFDTLTDACSDALWTAPNAGSPGRLWIWVMDGAKAGLWVRADGAADFTQVTVDAASTYGFATARAVLAASAPPAQVWVHNDQGNGNPPGLFRVTNPTTASAAAPVATAVVGVPNILRDQGFYDIAIAIDPGNASRVALAGSFLGSPSVAADRPLLTTQDGARRVFDASIVVAVVAPDPANGNQLTYGLTATPWTLVGIGVHPDVHALAYSNGGASLWTGCDGGIFRSDAPLRPAGFYARNEGLSISEPNYLACHPRCEGNLVVGLQDNGTVRRDSSAVWRMPYQGDGGGVVMNALSPDQYMAQYVRGSWRVDGGGGTGPLVRGGAIDTTERDVASFYSMPAGIAHVRTPAAPAAPTPISQTLIGTTRLWYSDDFGTTWVTLPSTGDPLGGVAKNYTVDDLAQPITVCRWQSPDVAWVLCEQRIRRYARTPGSHDGGGAGTWTANDVMPPGYVPPPGKEKKRPPRPPSLLDATVWTDIAVNLDPPPAAGQPPAQHGTLGALYVGTIGHPTNTAIDTLWWFDGTAQWIPTALRGAVPAPVTAVACSPARPNEVWVGTTVGVWQGTRSAATPPVWTWTQRVNGLPEAAVEDLALFEDAGLVLLRAAIASRGVWELRLDSTDVQDLTYVRAHDDDLRHRARAVGKKRDLVTDRSWHGSPDVRPRVAPRLVPAPATLPWRRSPFTGDTESLRRFQTALRASTGDPRVVPNGIWDAYFSEVLRDLGAPTVPIPAAPPIPAGNAVRITPAFWNQHMKAPHATAEPWGAGPPTEADLYELTAPLAEGDLASASCQLPRRPCKVDVVVHRRERDAIDGASVRVTLLRWIDPAATHAAKWDKSSTWFAGSVGWTAAVNQVLNSADGKTALALDAGWRFVLGSGAADVHRLTLAGQTMDPLHAGVATFDLDLSTAKRDSLVLLVAIIRAGSDIALAPATVQDLAMTSANVAVRSVHVV